MKADTVALLLCEMAELVDSGADILYTAAAVIRADQAKLRIVAGELQRLHEMLPPAEPSR